MGQRRRIGEVAAITHPVEGWRVGREVAVGAIAPSSTVTAIALDSSSPAPRFSLSKMSLRDASITTSPAVALKKTEIALGTRRR